MSQYSSIKYFQNTLNWMKENYPDFVWTYSEKRRIELDPGAETFIIAPEKLEVVNIKGSNTVSF